jgi:hypothetical protein
MIKNFYVVCFKETTIDNGVINTESGVCEYGYLNEEDAIQKVYELTDERLNDNLDLVDEGKCYRDSNENGDWQMVTVYDYTYEYWVSKIGVEV